MFINKKFPSPNYTPLENRKIDYVIMHFTEMTFSSALNRLTDETSQVSAHYLIKEDGEIFQLVQDEYVAWHSGKSNWHKEDGLNKNSIGIELDNSGESEFPDSQMKACIDLSQHLKKKYSIPKHNFIGHSDVAPNRKIDPGLFFNWKLLAENELAIWHFLDNLSPDKILFRFGDQNTQIKTLQNNLQKIGYKIENTGIFDLHTNFVVRAFQSKFYPEIITNKGIKFYQNNESKYYWDSNSQLILEKLLSKIPA